MCIRAWRVLYYKAQIRTQHCCMASVVLQSTYSDAPLLRVSIGQFHHPHHTHRPLVGSSVIGSWRNMTHFKMASAVVSTTIWLTVPNLLALQSMGSGNISPHVIVHNHTQQLAALHVIITA
eukprot:TRINITY_DN2194_c0_g3_i1.p1 TRINITY_DN2194_c0_g3~~TRINITY_DN2194_c0_g3_i1.p1  ORF type:complete len:121 (+),score=1.29 TRINITY_DN2194_c0_g3_i1:372-734(+)